MRNCQTILQSGWTIFHAHQYCLRTPVFPYLHWHLYCQGFLVFCYSNRCIVVSHLGLICISLVTNSGNFDVCLFTLHMYIYIHIYIFFGEVSIEIFYPFLLGCLCFYYWVLKALYISWIHVSYQIHVLQIFSHSLAWLFIFLAVSFAELSFFHLDKVPLY